MMANWSGRSLAAARLHNAGISLRLVRSPLAPKMTMMHGSALRIGVSESCGMAALEFTGGDLSKGRGRGGRLEMRSGPPLPGADLGKILAVFGDVALVLDEFSQE